MNSKLVIINQILTSDLKSCFIPIDLQSLSYSQIIEKVNVISVQQVLFCTYCINR